MTKKNYGFSDSVLQEMATFKTDERKAVCMSSGIDDIAYDIANLLVQAEAMYGITPAEYVGSLVLTISEHLYDAWLQPKD